MEISDKDKQTEQNSKKSVASDSSRADAKDTNLKKDIKITTPGVWIVLVGICVALAGFIVWCSLYDIETTKHAVAIQSKNDAAYCFMQVDYDDYIKISKYNTVYVDGVKYSLDTESKEAHYGFFKPTNDENDLLARGVYEQEIDIDYGDKYYMVPIKDANLSTEISSAYVVLDRQTPVSFLFNYKWGQ